MIRKNSRTRDVKAVVQAALKLLTPRERDALVPSDAAQLRRENGQLRRLLRLAEADRDLYEEQLDAATTRLDAARANGRAWSEAMIAKLRGVGDLAVAKGASLDEIRTAAGGSLLMYDPGEAEEPSYARSAWATVMMTKLRNVGRLAIAKGATLDEIANAAGDALLIV